MSDAERAALLWLDEMIIGARTDYAQEHARTLKGMLARPVMPAEPTQEMLVIMREAPLKSGDADDDSQPEWGKRIMRASYRALYAHLSRPATRKEWHISGCGRAKAPYTHHLTADTPEQRNEAVKALLADGFARVIIDEREVQA